MKMKIKTLSIATAMFFSFQASAVPCHTAENLVRILEGVVEQMIEDHGFGSDEHRVAVGSLAAAENLLMNCGISWIDLPF